MANQQGNGRKAMPDDTRESWRPQDENGARSRRLLGDSDDRERMYRNDRDDNYLRDRERFGSYWGDRSRRWDRDEGYRSPEDRSYASRDVGYPGGFEDRPHERGLDERWSQGRGARWDEREERRPGSHEGMYGHGAGSWGGYGRESERSIHGMGYGTRTLADDYGEMARNAYGPPIGAAQAGWNQQRMYPGARPVGYESPYREPGMQDREAMVEQSRYGSQGYQGWGQQGPTGRPPPGRTEVSHRGKGPSGYTRSDERIREMVCEALTEDHNVDATNIEVVVKDGEVTLSGTVEDRMQKRMAEDCVEQVAGVRDVHNQIRIAGGKKTSG